MNSSKIVLTTQDIVNKEFTIECQLTQDEAKELGLDAN